MPGQRCSTWPSSQAGDPNGQFRVRPGAGQFPRGGQRAAQVEAAVDQHTWDTGQASGIAQQRTVFQPCFVGEVVRTDANKRQLVCL
jgi:hypothetical protein